MKPKLSIIIVNWNTKELLKNCLESIFQSLRPNAKSQMIKTEIIVVDNGSSDGSREYLKKNQSSIINHQSFKVIFNDRNLGFAKANNQGIKVAQGEYVLLLNSDTIVKDKAIKKTIDWMENNPQADIVGCKLLNQDGSPQASVGKFPHLVEVFKMLFLDFFTGGLSMSSPDKITEVDWIMGAFMMFRTSVFNKINGLDENIFMYMEEVEWCYRAKQAGLNIFFYPEAEIIHLKGGSSKSGRSGPILNIYKGLIYFYKKHKPTYQLIILKTLLKLKAGGAYILGLIFVNDYLRKTYGKAYSLV